MEQSWCFRGERLRYATQVPNATATVSEGADRPERSAGKKTFDNRILILRRFKRRFGSESNPSAKVLLFFDMAMGCPGLRALLVRIACNQATGYRGYRGYPTCVFFENCGIYRSLIILYIIKRIFPIKKGRR